MEKRLRILAVCISLLLSTVTYAEGSLTVCINNKPVEFDVMPAIIQDRTFVPMRKIFEELGCEVEWFEDTGTILATKNSKIIALQIGTPKIILTNIETGKTDIKETDVAPVIMDSRTLVPVRSISETLDCEVVWNEKEQTVLISTH